MRNVDIHSHFLPKLTIQELGMKIEELGDKKCKVIFNGRVIGPLPKSFFNIKERLNVMDELGIDFQVLSVAHQLFGYKFDEKIAEKLAFSQNDGLASIMKQFNDRVICNGTLPLSYPTLALKELDRIYYKLELSGIEIGTNIAGRNLDSPELFPIYEKLQDFDMAILVHPNDIVGEERMKKYYLPIVIGTLFETSIALASIIFGGVLESFPKLKFIFCHGGGAIPYQIGRIERALNVRQECKGLAKRKAMEYLRMVYYDTIVFDDKSLRLLIERVGGDNVLFGTDYPFDMGEWDSHLRVQKLDINNEIKDRILVKNFKRLYKIQ